MATKLKKGIHGMTRPRIDNVLGTAIVCNGRFNNIEGEIVNKADGHLKYLMVQIPSEYKNRVYLLHLLYKQCKDIKWKQAKK